jgi:integrase
LPIRRKPFFISVAPGVALGFRKNAGPGSWLVRCADGKGGAWTQGFAVADDREDADGERVLNFWQAQVRARELVHGKHSDAGKPTTVAAAFDDYERDLELRGGVTLDKVRLVRRSLTPALLERPVASLTMREVRRWRDARLASGLQAATVGRLSRVLAAVFNFAAAADPAITNKQAWAQGLEALPDSHQARVDSVLGDDEVRAVVAACYAFAPRLGLWCEVLATTGCRPIQASRLLVGDLQPGRLMMPTASKGRKRKQVGRIPTPIPNSLAAKLRAEAADRPGAAPLLRRPDGRPWQTYGHTVLFQKALAAAGLPKTVPYSMRHSSVVRNLQRGVPPAIVAAAHDTSVAMMRLTYAKFLVDHSEEMIRAVQIDLTAPGDASNVVPLAGRRS